MGKIVSKKMGLPGKMREGKNVKFPKVIILAAGQSKRMDPLPDKNFIKFCGKTLIEWQIEQMKDAGFREIAVVGGRHNLENLEKIAIIPRTIFDKSGRGAPSKKSILSHKKAKLDFEIIEQRHLEDGMAGAILAAQEWIGDSPFLVVSSNDIVEDSIFDLLKKAYGARNKSLAGFLVAKKVSEYFPGGYLKISGGNKRSAKITSIVEKPGAGKEPSDLVNIVFHLHLHPRELFSELKRVKTDRDDRYEVTLDRLIQRGETFVALPYSGLWRPIKYPWHLIEVWKMIFEKLVCRTKSRAKNGRIISRSASIAKSAVVRGDVIIEDGVKIFDHAVVQGPAYLGRGVIVANNALVRESHLGANSVAGFGTEIARSFLADGVWTHTNYIGDSIIGRNSSFGSGTVTGNLRLDEKNILIHAIDTGTNKLGAIIGENVRIGINVSLMPGVKIGNNSFIGAGISVAQDIADRKFVYGKWELTMKDNSATIDPSAREIMMQRLKKRP